MIGRILLGRYEITRLLGEGGMGRVYLSRQIDLGRQVVVKVMHEQIASDAKFRERFERETLLMARFQHPYAVTLYDASLNDPLGPCIIMEYVKGVNLDVLLLKNGRFTPARVGRLIGQLCEVLQAAHDQQIIHRDLKPANLMVVDAESPREKIKVMDFGLAKMIDAAALKKITDTKVDFAVGTPGYICPEQIRGEEVDHRGDLYSVGVLMYELLTGQLPFDRPSSMDILLAHVTELPPTFAELGLADSIPAPIEDVVMRLLEKDPKNRPYSAREVALAYEEALAEASSLTPVAAPPAPTPLPERMPEKAFQPHFVTPPDDPHSLLMSFKAWMPEKVALIKLRGYCYDFQGEILESKPGLVRVSLPGGTGADAGGGRLSWLGLIKKPSNTHLELRLIQDDPDRENLLTIEARFRPSDQGQSHRESWRHRCVQHFINLRGYLMGQTEMV